jgi:hypothetical protein
VNFSLHLFVHYIQILKKYWVEGQQTYVGKDSPDRRKWMRTARQLNAVYEKIISSDMSAHVKFLKLSTLIAEIERTYQLSSLTEEEKREKASIIALYEKINLSKKSL